MSVGCSPDSDADGGTGDGSESGSTNVADDGMGPTGSPGDASGSESMSASAEDGPTPTTSGTDAGTDDAADGSDTGGFPEPVPDDCITDVAAGHHAFECDGLTYDVEVPEACLGSACGMIFDVHGYTMSAQMQDSSTGMRALGQRHGYIVVQPNAEPDPPAASWNGAVDDPKVFDFMQRVAAAWHVDANRWHITGFSQGGYMSWRFICDHADVLASVAPAAACGNIGAFGDCAFSGDEIPSGPLDILYMHGTSDALVSFSCFGPRRDAVVAHYGLGPEELVTEDETHRWTRHTGDDMVLELIEHDYAAESFILGGHCFPGSNDQGDAPGQLFSYGCVDPTSFAWGEVVMQFFIAHPKD